MSFILKYWTSVAILIAGIIAAVANFYASKQDSEQKDKIEELGKIINQKVDRATAENLITDELEMDFSPSFNDNDIITVIVGGLTMTDRIKTIKERGKFGGLISLGEYEPVKIKVDNGKLPVNLIMIKKASRLSIIKEKLPLT